MKQAIREMGRLKDPLLTGHILAQRYLHATAWRSSFKELSNWLVSYNDHPDASRIYWLAKRRKPANARRSKAPKAGYLNGYGQAGAYGYRPRIPQKRVGRASPTQTAFVARSIRRAIRKGWPSGALDIVNESKNKRYLTAAEEGQLRGEIAHAYFIFGVDSKAIRQARYAIGIGGVHAQLAYWAGGLAAWRSGQINLAGQFFRTLADLAEASPGQRSAAAYWAHRIELRQGRPIESVRYLELSAREIDSFYGVVSRYALGQKIDISFDLPNVHVEFFDWLSKMPGGNRIFALLQLGETHAAERELRYLWMEMPDQYRIGVMRFAAEQGMAGLAFRIAEIIRKDTGVSWYGALYPHPQFVAEYSIDEALVWSISRQESGFNPRAKSSAKAAGLMQLMPATASFIARDQGYLRRKRHQLFEPELNLKLGQAYIQHLLDEKIVESSLIRLLAAYNGGPGNLRKWLAKVDHQGDPFLLVESIPARETRYYVKNVISNLGIYRQRFGQTAPALVGLATGNGGRFVPSMAANKSLTN
ncbi:lytic transglycosylase domain-containing protein [Candidatus Puniceispirillum sp.]|nr:lytic transglycosylase domain-containing protein [Candidatus Puniceispirillum sp.]